jgi:GNAT superfamily N-acetyltransferase
MVFIFTDGYNKDFIQLCRMLDDYLNEIAGGEENRKQYIPHNTTQDIHDVVVAYDGNIPVGCASFKQHGEGVAEVKRVFVKQDYRGQGTAKRLMALLEERAINKGYAKLILETGMILAEAMGLYRSLDFSVIENYAPYKNMAQSVCMQKLLKYDCYSL